MKLVNLKPPQIAWILLGLGAGLHLLLPTAYRGHFPMLIPPIGFFVSMSAVFIPFEEERLQEAFGDEYVRYARGVRRWV